MSESNYESETISEKAATADEQVGLRPIDPGGHLDPGYAQLGLPSSPLILDQKPLILGAMPRGEREGKKPFSGPSGQQITNLLPEAFRLNRLDELFDLAYLIPKWEWDQKFNRHKARIGVANLIRAGQIRRGRLVVAVGTNVVRTIVAEGQQPHGLFHARQVQAPTLRFRVKANATPRSWGMMAGEFWVVSFPSLSNLRHETKRLAREAMGCLVARDFLSLENGTWCTHCRSGGDLDESLPHDNVT
jgi:hypothetical protein